MANLTNAEEDRLLTESLTNVEVALLTADPTDAGTLTSEVAAASYGRVAASFTVTNGVATPTTDLDYGQAAEAWGNVTHVAVVAAPGEADAGTARWHGPLNTPKQIDAQDTFMLPAADVSVSLD